MSDIDALDDTTTTPEGEGSATTPDSTVSNADDQIASYRRRQAGAEAARQVAEAKAKELETELAKYRSAAQTESEKDLSELAATKARLEAAERTAAEAEKKAEARILDARFPNARKELPEVTDEVRLAKFEALLAEEEDASPTPLRHNETRSGTKGAAKAERTAADIRAELEATVIPWG